MSLICCKKYSTKRKYHSIYIPITIILLMILKIFFSNITFNKPSIDKQYYFLMIAIMSDAQEFAVRDIIRQTWLKLYNKGPKKKKHFFIIGIKNTPTDTLSKLKDEQMLYNDLAFLEDHVESYNNLARKTADTMRFMSKHYLFDYLLKVDTDSFVRIKPLIDYLMVLNHPRLYLGYMDGKSPVRRGNIKWKETDWNFCDLYIPYHTGGGYVLGRELVEFIANNFHLLKFFQNEDVSVATWIAGIDVKYIHDVRFDTEWDSRGCQNDYLITHKKSPHQLESLFNSLRTTGVFCEQEYVHRDAYNYNFSAPPSKCCITEKNNQDYENTKGKNNKWNFISFM